MVIGSTLQPAHACRLIKNLLGTFPRHLNLSLRQQVVVGRREFSSIPRQKNDRNKNNDAIRNNNNDVEEDTTCFNKQPFVQVNLQPGEWDINRKDPLARPKPPRNKLISAEDFANRPPVGFQYEFGSFEDSMIVLSWLDERTCKAIYSTYVDMMMRNESENPGRTSHEYACRVLAQRFQITEWRAAGVVQLQHAEEQMRRNNPELLCDDVSQYADSCIRQNISDAYKSERSQPPNRGGQQQPFVEDPVGIHGLGEPDEISSSFVTADDIYDMETKLHNADVSDEELAKVLIDEHVYKEDVDESKLSVKIDGSTKRLIKAQQKQKAYSQSKVATGGSKEEDATVTTTEESTTPNTASTNEKGKKKRSRWKYVAKVVNTRAMQKKGRKLTSYNNNNMENTIVEENGSLRVATVEEAKKVAWKPTRTKSNEYIYEGVQKAWLKKTTEGNTTVWGKAQKTAAVDSVIGRGDFKNDDKVKAAKKSRDNNKDDAVTIQEERIKESNESQPKSDESDKK